jgi:hypothetical protein
LVAFIFYSAPIGSLFGDNYTALKFFNAALHISTITVWGLGLRHYYGPRIALISSAIFCFYPEYWFTTTLATTDNAAMLCIALFILLVPKVNCRGRTGAWAAILLAATMFLCQQLRSSGALLIIALLVWAAATPSKNRLYVVTMATFAGAIYFALCKIFLAAFPSSLPDLFNLQEILSAIDFHTTQDFSVNYTWANHFWKSLPDDSKIDVSVYKIATELRFGLIDWPGYVFRKIEIAFSGTGYYGLSSFPFPAGNPDTANVANSNIPFSSAAFPWFTACVSCIICGACLAIPKIRRNGPAFSATLLTGSFALVVLGFGEVQARYSVLITPALSLFFAIALFPADAHSRGICDDFRFSCQELLGGVLGLIAIYLTAFAGFAILGPQAGIGQRAQLQASRDCDNRDVAVATTYKLLRVTMRADARCANVRIPLPAQASTLSFFVSGSKFPFRFEQRVQSPFRYELIDGDTRLFSGSLGSDSVHWTNVALPNRTTHDFTIRVERVAPGVDDYLDFSLLRVKR